MKKAFQEILKKHPVIVGIIALILAIIVFVWLRKMYKEWKARLDAERKAKEIEALLAQANMKGFDAKGSAMTLRGYLACLDSKFGCPGGKWGTYLFAEEGNLDKTKAFLLGREIKELSVLIQTYNILYHDTDGGSLAEDLKIQFPDDADVLVAMLHGL